VSVKRTTVVVAIVGVMAGAGVAAADVGAQIEAAKAALARKDHGKTVAALEQALAEARQAAPLTAQPFLLVTGKAPIYGAYEPRPDNVFGGDEEMYFYFEPKNLVYPKNAQGLYAPGLTVDLEMLDAAGDVVARKDAFGDFSFASRSRLQDIFVNLTLTMTGAPAGQYTVRYTVRDKNSPKTAILTQSITRK
jgi:hypothetical protein